MNHTSKGGGHVPYIWIVGGLTVVLALLVICILVCICLRSSSCSSNDEDSGGGHSFQILRKSGFFCGCARYYRITNSIIRSPSLIQSITNHKVTLYASQYAFIYIGTNNFLFPLYFLILKINTT